MDLSDIPIPFGKCQDRLICDCRSISISVLISVLPELLEEIVNQVADEDLLPKAILGFPLIRDELIEFGGPERVMDNFLVRGGDDPVTLSTLIPYVPVECAIAKGIARVDEEFVKKITKVWGVEVDSPIISTQGHILSMQLGWKWGVENIKAVDKIPNHKLLLQEYYVKSGQWEKIDWNQAAQLEASLLAILPVDRRSLIGEWKRLVLDISECPRKQLDQLVEKVEGGNLRHEKIIEAMMGYASPERIGDFAHLSKATEYGIKKLFFLKRYMDGLHALGTLSVDELDAYELVMDPDEHILGHINHNVYTITLDIYAAQQSDYGAPWDDPGQELIPEYYSEEALLDKISRWFKSGEVKGVMDDSTTFMMGYRDWDKIFFPHPKTYIGDQKGTNAILLAWCWCGCPDS